MLKVSAGCRPNKKLLSFVKKRELKKLPSLPRNHEVTNLFCLLSYGGNSAKFHAYTAISFGGIGSTHANTHTDIVVHSNIRD